MRSIVFALALAAVGLFAAGATAAPDPTPPPSTAPDGDWGGTGIRVTVRSGGAEFDLDGAHGKASGPLALDAEGRFDVAGTLVRERPGPIRQGEAGPPAASVRYRGTVHGDALTLEIVPADGKDRILGPLKAVRGAPARVRKMA